MLGRSRSDRGDDNWRTGSEAIRMNFMGNLPPNYIYGGDRFDIYVEIKNVGAAPVSGELYLSGYDEGILTGISRSTGFSIMEHKTRYNPEGGYTVLNQQGLAVMPPGVPRHPTTVVATACYNYETLASPTVCIDPNPNKVRTSRTCSPGSIVGLGSSQGGPVAVSSVVQESRLGVVTFRIYLTNVGGGKVLDASKTHYCMSPYLSFADEDIVYVESVSLGTGAHLSCNPAQGDGIRLQNGRTGFLICTGSVDENVMDPYTTTLNIKLHYGYMQSISRPVTIVTQ